MSLTSLLHGVPNYTAAGETAAAASAAAAVATAAAAVGLTELALPCGLRV